jgi:hypothetical protein
LFYVATDRTPVEFLRPPDYSEVHSHVVNYARQTYAGIVDTQAEHGRVLTDDYNPVEFYDARNRENLRRYLARRAIDL